MFDESHAAHVCCQIIEFTDSISDGAVASCAALQVEGQILDVFKPLIPLLERLQVDCANLCHTFVAQIRNQPSANEATRAAN